MKLTTDPTDPRAWLARAQSSLELATLGAGRPRVYWEDLCFDCQQAAERALKAVCVHHGIDFPPTHSLVYLTDLLKAAGVAVPAEVKAADVLTVYALQVNYTCGGEIVTEEEYRAALQEARTVVAWAEAQIGPVSATGPI
jgi:HEPN domain-containing protein